MIKIKQANLTDLELLKSISDSNGVRNETGYLERCLSEQKEKKRVILKALYDEKACAFGMLNWEPKYSLYNKLGIPEIQDLNTLQEFRRKGVASSLIKRFENITLEQGIEQIGISVALHSHFGPAQRLYSKLGFIPDGLGVSYDRQPVTPSEFRPIDDDLCLMLIKSLSASDDG